MPCRSPCRAVLILLSFLMLPACTRARLELDKMSGAEFPTEQYLPPGATGSNFLNIPQIFTEGGRVVAVDLDDDDIPELDLPGLPCTGITNGELEGLVNTYRDSGTTPTEYLCFGALTCTDHPVYGIIVNHKYGGSTGTCQNSKAGFMGDPANRGIFFVFYAVSQISASEKNLFKATVHEFGHTFNLHHEDALGGSIMTTPVTSIDDSMFFSDTSEAHLQDHPENMMWPNSGPFDVFTQQHGQSHMAQAVAPSDPVAALRLSLDIEPPAPFLGEPVRAVVRLRNEGSESVTIPPDLAPETGTLRIEITRPDGTPSGYLPLVVVDSLAEPERLPPGEERTASFPVFFGAHGWSFDRPGTYVLRARLVDPSAATRSAVASEPISFTVLDEDGAAQRLLDAGEASAEAGKFLTWLGGDHLHAGISVLKDLVVDYPDSVLADHARLALGVNASRDVRSFALGKIRRAECWAALHFLGEIDSERFPAALRIRKSLAQARCLLRAEDANGARGLIDAAARVAAGRGDLSRLFEDLVTLHALPAPEDPP